MSLSIACARCGTMVLGRYTQSTLFNQPIRYCSAKCRGLSTRTGGKRQCLICEKQFERGELEAGGAFRRRKTCSIECRKALLSRRSKRQAENSEARTMTKACEACGKQFARTVYHYASGDHLEGLEEFHKRRACSAVCRQRLRVAFRENEEAMERSAEELFVQPFTIGELATKWSVDRNEAKRAVLRMLRTKEIVRVGRRNKNEPVYGIAQESIRHLPMLVEGRGFREHNCQRSESMECVDNFDLTHPNYDGQAHCPPGCQWMIPITQEYWRAYATQSQSSPIAAAQEHGE